MFSVITSCRVRQLRALLLFPPIPSTVQWHRIKAPQSLTDVNSFKLHPTPDIIDKLNQVAVSDRALGMIYF